jgi:hypothetical protein
MSRVLRRASVGLAGAVVLGAVLGTSSPALAHEGRHVAGYDVEVGFGTEPAYAGFENSVEFIAHDEQGSPVTDIGDGLKLEVVFGDQSQEFPLEPNFDVEEGFGEPGDYRAWFIPTRPGPYTFHFTGQLNGQSVDETFTSGPTTFSEVVSPSEVQFPVQDPSTGELNERLDQETTRTTNAVKAASADAAAAADDAGSAKTLAYVGIGVGVIGLVVALVALLGRRRTAGPATADAG